MKFKPYKTVISFLLFASFSLIFGQNNIPEDFDILAVAGGTSPWTENAVLHITANGQSEYVRFIPGDVGEPPLEEKDFTLSASELDQIWQSIQNNDFFNLATDYSDSLVTGTTFARLTVRANGITHEVRTQNVTLSEFDNIILTINNVTPSTYNLVYEVYTSPIIIPIDPCDINSATSSALYLQDDILRLKTHNGSAANLSNRSLINPSNLNTPNDSHAGTVVSYRIPLKKAVASGIATLEGKGNYYGDQVSITVNNTTNVTSDDLSLTLYLEFWGTHANSENVKRIESAIENTWGGHTTGGKNLTVDVVTRLNTSATSAPSTAGYHQIELVGSGTSYVSSIGEINEGIRSGQWRTEGTLLDGMYAHEAGHLFGLPDRYNDYNKQSDGTWRRKNDGAIFTSEDLAKEIQPNYSNITVEQLKTWLSKEMNQRVTTPKSGHENDIMADKTASVQQSDIDAIASSPGLTVEVSPGNILVNKEGSEQNFVITRSENMFVNSGDTKTLNGIYVACVDLYDHIPSFGRRFDLAPSLGGWEGIEAASILQQLVDYIDDQEIFCENDYSSQIVIWRITNNLYTRSSGVEEFLENAGINIGSRFLDFPRLSNPDSSSSNTTILIPAQLLVANVLMSTPFVSMNTTVNATANVSYPNDLQSLNANYSWSLHTPQSSNASIINPQNSSVSFIPDIRGEYKLQYLATITGLSGNDTITNNITSEVAKIITVDNLTETFESGDIQQVVPFNWQLSGDALWEASNATSNSGDYSAVSGLISDNQSTNIELEVEISDNAEISFAFMVSSEELHDYLRFFIDHIEQDSWSGITNWERATYSLSAGKHTLTWSYEKDGSDSEGSDGTWIDDLFLPTGTVTSVFAKESIPLEFDLSQNFPNPFNPTTTINYQLPSKEFVSLKVFDIQGRQIEVLVNEDKDAGYYQVTFDGGMFASGVYFYRLQAGSFSETKKFVLLK
ncbi:MAG: T9SS type A sorting domain-containing protein [Ignavibacteria bacterium]